MAIKKKAFTAKIKIKKGDQVKVIAGVDRGKTGAVLEVFPGKNRAIVEDVRVMKKHAKPSADSPGGIIDKAASIHISNLQLIDPKTGEGTRVGRKLVDGKLARYSKKSGEIIK